MDGYVTEEIKRLHTLMVLAKAEYESAEEAYADANIQASPFRPGERIVYREREYEIDRVNSRSHGATDCLAFPIKKNGEVSQRNSAVIYSDCSAFIVKGRP